MALTCKQQEEAFEETVLQPVDQWVQQQEQQCKNEPCNWWTLCLNKLLCWIVWTLAKICVWVLMVVVRWTYRTVCTIVSLIIGLVALIFGNSAIITQALGDLWELVKDAFYSAVGSAIYIGLDLVDGFQTILGLQNKKRPLTGPERETLRKVFRNSLRYDAISIIEGNAGLLGVSGQAYTMGFNIYIPKYTEETLVHECVHVWQFQFEGTKYIGQSALTQLDAKLFSKNYSPYTWVGSIGTNINGWYLLKSVEAQAQFITDVFRDGEFVFADKKASPSVDKSSGAFFREEKEVGQNKFEFGGDPYTDIANEAWRILRTG